MRYLRNMIVAAALSIGLCSCVGGNDIRRDDISADENWPSGMIVDKASCSEQDNILDKFVNLYPIAGNKELSLVMSEWETVTRNGAKDITETPFGKAWQEATGISLKVDTLSNNQEWSLFLRENDYPDLILFYPDTYPGGTRQAIQDGLIEPLNDYLDEYMPDYKQLLNKNDEWRKDIETVDGDIVGAAFICGDQHMWVNSGLQLRRDWLKELGLAEPRTPEQFYEVLKAFRDYKNVRIPFSVTRQWIYDKGLMDGIFTSPFGLVRGGFYQVDGEVRWGLAELEYKDVLIWLHKLYNEGLLDKNFQTLDDNTVMANIMAGISGATIINLVDGMGRMLDIMEDQDPNFDLVGVAPFVEKDGDKSMYGSTENAVVGCFMVMTPDCKDKITAALFLNYGYTPEGHMLMNFGIEGESYTIVDGEPVYTDMIMDNSDMVSKQDALSQYTMAWNSGPFVQDIRYFLQYANRPQQIEARQSYANTDVEKYRIPFLPSTEESAVLEDEIGDYAYEMFVRYVTGLMPIDTFESIYLKKLSEMGVERMIQLKQEALEMYNKR